MGLSESSFSFRKPFSRTSSQLLAKSMKPLHRITYLILITKSISKIRQNLI